MPVAVVPVAPITNPFGKPRYLVSEPAPAASLALLRAVYDGPMALGLHPYAGCARIASTPSGGRYWQQMVGEMSLHAVAAVGGNASLSGGRVPSPVQIATTGGGLTGADIVTVTSLQWACDSDPLDTTATAPQLVVTSSQIDDAPAAAKNRALQLDGDETPEVSLCWLDRATVWSVAPFHWKDNWP